MVSTTLGKRCSQAACFCSVWRSASLRSVLSYSKNTRSPTFCWKSIVLPGTTIAANGGGGGGGGAAASGGGGGRGGGGGGILVVEQAASRRTIEKVANFALVVSLNIFCTLHYTQK